LITKIKTKRGGIGWKMEKVKTGIFGLNPLLDGGFNKNSVTVVVGAPGAGKTTFVNQFLRKGLEEGGALPIF